MRADLSSWLRSTLWGVLSTIWLSVTLFALFGPKDPYFPNRFWLWAIMMGVTTALGLVLSLVLFGVDLLFLHWRNLPNGRVAFFSGVAATLLTAAGYVAYPPGKHGAWGLWILAAVLPMVAAAIVSRWIGGTRR